MRFLESAPRRWVSRRRRGRNRSLRPSSLFFSPLLSDPQGKLSGRRVRVDQIPIHVGKGWADDVPPTPWAAKKPRSGVGEVQVIVMLPREDEGDRVGRGVILCGLDLDR